MIDTDAWNAKALRKSLGAADTDQETANQPGAIAHGDEAHVAQRAASINAGLAHDGQQALGVGAAGDLRHHSPVLCVEFMLAGDDTGKHGAITDDRRGGLIARTLYAEDKRRR
jgi:hypothetical protein